MNIFYNQVTDVCGSAAVWGKIMRSTEESNKIVVLWDDHLLCNILNL